MGSARSFAAENPFVGACSIPYELDASSFLGQGRNVSNELQSSSDTNDMDIGLAIPNIFLGNIRPEPQLTSSRVNSSNQSTDIVDSKKPNKSLTCPRCKSFDTKFCYYNNYNVNQPRHFCKGCQRYWTAGGTLRNVAIGAGRRKRKQTSLEAESVMSDNGTESCDAVEFASSKVLNNKVGRGSTNAESSRAMSQPTKVHALSSSFAVPSNPSLACQASTFDKYIRTKRAFTFLDKVGLSPCDSHDIGEDGFVLGEQAQEDVDSHSNNSSESFERQPSNETFGCASSVTTQAVSMEACAPDVKSDAMDSEVSKNSDLDVQVTGITGSEGQQSMDAMPWKMQMEGGELDSSSFTESKVNRVAVSGNPSSWRGFLESSVPGTTWPMISAALTWGPNADRALSWDLPWGPAATAVDAAKAALIPSVGASQELESEHVGAAETRLWVPKTIRIKDSDEAACSSIWLMLGIGDREGVTKHGFRSHTKEVSDPATLSQW